MSRAPIEFLQSQFDNIEELISSNKRGELARIFTQHKLSALEVHLYGSILSEFIDDNLDKLVQPRELTPEEVDALFIAVKHIELHSFNLKEFLSKMGH